MPKFPAQLDLSHYVQKLFFCMFVNMGGRLCDVKDH